MLQFDVVRGKHSTGIIAVDRQGKMHTDKEPWLPQDFLEKGSVAEMFRKNLTLLIGHNRHATVGAKNKAGAHPFEFENVIGVHNGTTPKFSFVNGAKYEVDSEALYDNMNEEGAQDTWLKVKGAAALAYYDKGLNNFHLLRNDERPMNYAFTEDGLTMLFASEPWMIQVAASRAKVKIANVMRTALDTLYTVPVGQAGKIVPQTEKLEAYVAPKPVSTGYSQGRGGFMSKTPDQARANWWNYSPGDEVHVEVVGLEELSTGATRVSFRDFYNTRFSLECTIGIGYEELLEDLDNHLGLWSVKVSSAQQTRLTVNYKSLERLGFVEDEEEKGGEDSFFVENHEKLVISRDMFRLGASVDNDCCLCGSPLFFDDAGSGFVGFDCGAGTLNFICSECQKENPWIGSYGDTLKITKIKGHV